MPLPTPSRGCPVGPAAPTVHSQNVLTGLAEADLVLTSGEVAGICEVTMLARENRTVGIDICSAFHAAVCRLGPGLDSKKFNACFDAQGAKALTIGPAREIKSPFYKTNPIFAERQIDPAASNAH
jgi:hypothetical protein